MSAFLKKNFLVLVIVTATVLAAYVPQWGLALKNAGLVPIFVACIFLCQGMSLDSRDFVGVGNYLKAVFLGTIASFVMAPILAFIVVRMFDFQDDDLVGFMLMCAMSPTLVSGIVIAVHAGGDRATAVVVTVVLNLLATLTVPFNLGWMLDQVVSIDRMALLLKLVLLVLCPSIIGAIIRRRVPRIAQQQRIISMAPILMMGTIVFVGVSQQADRLFALGIAKVLLLVLPSLLVHVALLLALYWGGGAVNLSESARRSLAFVASQKTLPLAIAVWSTVFAEDYPLALIAPLIFHFSQIYFDSLVATKFVTRNQTATA